MQNNVSNENINKWDFADKDNVSICEDTRPTLTYWADVWYRFKKNKLAILGLVMTALIFIAAFIGPLFSDRLYSDQVLENSNIPPRFIVRNIGDADGDGKDDFVYVHKEFKIISVTEDGHIIGSVPIAKNDIINRQNTFQLGDKEIVVDFKKAADKSIKNADEKYDLLVDGQKIENGKKVFNKTNFFGTDSSGRDILI